MKKTTKSLLISVFMICASALYAQEPPKLDVPYVPTSQNVVDAMLKLANVKQGDVVYDLGCGDGRIVVTAAKKHGATGIGFDIDPKRIAEANENARKAGISDKVKFMNANLFETDLSGASVITMYLLPTVNMKLRPKIMALKPGTRMYPMLSIWATGNQKRLNRLMLLPFTSGRYQKNSFSGPGIRIPGLRSKEV